ncbi:aspartate ammonia-lyase [Candidatus Sumerlaeota bacterium]|nr:aspartate ammonia-lyase [Candidatus Sumerlaeota bacterium]
MKTRTEKDSLGRMQVPDDAYWGCQTARALANFPISGLRHDPKFVDAFVMIKKAAARANGEAGAIAPDQADAIAQACDEILGGELRDQFVVDVFQMGAGTSFHMNVNEVLANRANEILGGAKGAYDRVHPNNHVNFGQSTNDAFPTAIRLAILLCLRDVLHAPLRGFEQSLREKGREFDDVLKSARTHLQDAVPIRLGQEFAAYAEAVRQGHLSLAVSSRSCGSLGIGGSAAGTGLNTAQGYRERVIELLRGYSGLASLRPSLDMREAMQSQRPVADVSAALRNVALEIGRIANDLRLLSSGPTTGLGEIALPAVAPGSSIMPGKVNPSMLEMLNMVCFQVVGCDTVVAQAVAAGQLELNVMMPVMAYNVLFAIRILASALDRARALCIDGIAADSDRCRRYAEGSMGLATALNPAIGYSSAAKVAHEALASGTTIPAIVREMKILPEDRLRRVLDPRAMTEPGIPGEEE